MKCHVVPLLCPAALAGCSSGSPIEGSILSASLRDLDGDTAEGVEVCTIAPGATQDRAVRVKWAFQVEQSDRTHPFGGVDVTVERNELGATELSCEADDPELALLLNGDRVWMIRLACAYEAEGQTGRDISARLWANGLLTQG